MDTTVVVLSPSPSASTHLQGVLGRDFTIVQASTLGGAIRACLDPAPVAVTLVADDLPDPAVACQALRALGPFPLVTVWNRVDARSAIACLDEGADAIIDLCDPDFLPRFRAVLRFAGAADAGDAPQQLVWGDVAIDITARTVHLRGQPVKLTPREFGLLTVLMEAQGGIVTNQEILARVWGDEFADDLHYVRLYIGYLRRKLGDSPQSPQLIVNHWGSGYRLATPAPAEALVMSGPPSGHLQGR